MTDEGGTAVIGSTHDRAWPGAVWAADPAAIDGCLQLARLWGIERGGAPSLPGRIGSCRIFRQAAAGADLRRAGCRAAPSTPSGASTTST